MRNLEWRPPCLAERPSREDDREARSASGTPLRSASRAGRRLRARSTVPERLVASVIRRVGASSVQAWTPPSRSWDAIYVPTSGAYAPSSSPKVHATAWARCRRRGGSRDTCRSVSHRFRRPVLPPRPSRAVPPQLGDVVTRCRTCRPASDAAGGPCAARSPDVSCPAPVRPGAPPARRARGRPRSRLRTRRRGRRPAGAHGTRTVERRTAIPAVGHVGGERASGATGRIP